MELESAILPPAIRLNRANELYALRVTTLSENHPIRQRTPYTFPSGLGTGLDIDENHYLNWNQHPHSLVRKKHSTQLIRVLYSLCKLLPNRMDLKVSSNEINNSSWDELPPVDIQISKLDKESTVRNHLNTLKGLFSMEKRWKNAIFYLDGSKSDQNLGAGLCYMFGDNVKKFS